MDGTKINYSTKLKYLGITITKRLTWSEHVKNKNKECGFLLNKIRTAIGRDWGLSPDKLLWIYTAIIRPGITYGALVWAHDINTTVEHKLDQIQRRALVAICKPYKSVTTRAMEAIIGIPPIKLYLQECGLVSRFRVRDVSNKPTWDGVGDNSKRAQIMGHMRSWDDQLNCIEETSYPKDNCLQYRNWNNNKSVVEPIQCAYTLIDQK